MNVSDDRGNEKKDNLSIAVMSFYIILKAREQGCSLIFFSFFFSIA